MGTALHFNEEGRALFMARVLAAAGYGIVWSRKNPLVVMTSTGRARVKELSVNNKGVVEEWWKSEDIDVGARAIDCMG